MKRLSLSAPGKRGIAFAVSDGAVEVDTWFGMPGAGSCGIPECQGIFLLHTASGRFEGPKWRVQEVRQEADRLLLTMLAGGYRLDSAFILHRSTGVICRRDSLTNLAEHADTIFACLPRVGLQGHTMQMYGQYSGWCAENQGAWQSLRSGRSVLENSSGRSTDSAAPFACLRQAATGIGAAVHVLPVGDWCIQAKRIAAQRTSFVVWEAGLRSDGLHMEIQAGETLRLPELLYVGFQGEVEDCAEPLQRYLLDTYPRPRITELVYNTWFFDFDVLEPVRLRAQVWAARAMGCRTFVVDAGWFGRGTDWENQVGCWEECQETAFCGGMRHFAEFVRANGMNFGLWMEPERTCAGTQVYREHPDWFLDADTIIFDLANEQVRQYLAETVSRVIQMYDVRWLKWDYNSNLFRDLTGSNFYRYYAAERVLFEEIRRRNPGVVLEGCASGGLRTDIVNTLQTLDGHFISDTVHPLECLRMRQNISLRLLPAQTGAWLALYETQLGIGSYFCHDRTTRTKLLASGDPWWSYTWDVTADFALKASLLGQWGLSGDLTSLGAETAAAVQKAAAFYQDHRSFMSRTVCHALTAVQDLNDITGWTALQYENVDGKGSLLFVFRLVDDGSELVLFPKHLESGGRYLVRTYEGGEQVMTGEQLDSGGLRVRCETRYSAQLLEILPIHGREA